MPYELAASDQSPARILRVLAMVAALVLAAVVIEPFVVQAQPAPSADLGIAKDAPPTRPSDASFDYTLTVTNTGPDASSGWVVSDTVPPGLTVDEVSTEAVATCAIDGRNVTCVGGGLAVDAPVTIIIEVTPQPDTPECVTNIASVLGNEPDPNPDNDEAAATSCAAGITIGKSVDPASGTAVETGDTLEYTLTFTNESGQVAAPLAYDDYIADVLDDATILEAPSTTSPSVAVSPVVGDRFSVLGFLVPSESATVTYTVEVLPDGQRGDDVLGNFVVEPGQAPPPGDPGEVCPNWDLPCTSNPVAELVVSKSVDPVDGSSVEAGDELTYTVTFDNLGSTDADVAHDDVVGGVLDDAELVSAPSTSGLDVSPVDGGRFTVSGTLAAGTTATVSYTVEVLPDEDRNDDVLDDFVVEEGEDPPPECGADDPLCTSNPVEELVVSKTVDPVDGSSVEVGDELTYTVTFDNLGSTDADVAHDDVISGVLDDATVTAGPSTESVLDVSLVDGGRFTVSGTLAAGTTATVSYTVEVLPDEQRGDDVLGNFVVEEGEDPPPECGADDPLCTSNPVSELVVTKTVDPTDGSVVAAGDQLTYTITISNVGAGTGEVDHVDHLGGVIDDADVVEAPATASDALDVSVITDETFTVTGALVGGASGEVTYTVEVLPDGQRGDDGLANFVLETAQEPALLVLASCVGDDQTCTGNPIEPDDPEPDDPEPDDPEPDEPEPDDPEPDDPEPDDPEPDEPAFTIDSGYGPGATSRGLANVGLGLLVGLAGIWLLARRRRIGGPA